jgi:hypothetical protein
MSDQCFLCRINTDKGQCVTCQAKCHDECWVAYCINSNHKDLKCPQCSSPAYTDLIQSEKEYIKRKAICMMKEHIRKNSGSMSLKIIFDYIFDNMKDFEPNFLQSIKEKLIFLYINNSWIYAEHFHDKFFNTDILSN